MTVLMSTQNATVSCGSVSGNDSNKTINPEDHSPQTDKEYTMMAAG
jgi:hypothetical protein